MHYFGVVLVPTDTESIDAVVGQVMEPYGKHAHPRTGKWDWWQIGGRYTGRWSGYDPAKDPANLEPCDLCDGTGLRDDTAGRAHRATNPTYTCNGCGHEPHPGTRVKWPTQWKRHDGDVVPVTQLLDAPDMGEPYSALTPAGWFERETWDGRDFIKDEDWSKTYRAALEPYRATHRAVIVDYHD